MFNNRSLRMSFERTPTQTNPTPVDSRIKRAEIEATLILAKKHARDIAVGGVTIYAAVKSISTLSEIAINISPKR